MGFMLYCIARQSPGKALEYCLKEDNIILVIKLFL